MLLLLALCAPLRPLPGADESTSPTLAQATLPSEADVLNLSDLPQALVTALREADSRIERSETAVRKSLEDYLKAEKEERFADAYALIISGLRQKFLADETNQAIISDIGLYKNPPANPTPNQREAIERVKALVDAGKLSVQIEDPALWTYQFTHSIGAVEGRFESNGPYVNEFRLQNYTIVDVHLVSDDLAAAWVAEDILMPVEIIVKRLSVFLLKPENGEWRIYGHRGVDGPRIHEWLGLKTTLWPDQLEYQVQNPGAPAE